MDRSDEDLLAAYIEGDEAAFSTLVERHLKGIYSFIYRLMGDAIEAEDITQETFLKAWKNAKNYRSEASKFKTWVYRIARNSAIDYLRKKKHVPLSHFESDTGQNVLLDSLEDTADLPEIVFAQTEDAEALQAALLTLPIEAREILTLHYTSGLTFLEIGELLGEPQNTVKSRHYRAIHNLRAAYKEKIDAPKLSL